VQLVEIKRQMPIVDQVTLILHERILDGIFLPGDKLPSEQELSQELGVSRGTVRSALAALSNQGLIDRRQGDGTYVSSTSPELNSFMHAIWEFVRLIESSGRTPSITPLSLQKRNSTLKEAQALEIEEKAEVVQVERIFSADNQPIIFSTNISPVDLFCRDLEELNGTLGIHEFLGQYCDREIASADVNISPVLPNEKVQEALSIDKDHPVFMFEEIFRDVNQVPLVYAVNYYADQQLSLQGVRPWYSISQK